VPVTVAGFGFVSQLLIVSRKPIRGRAFHGNQGRALTIICTPACPHLAPLKAFVSVGLTLAGASRVQPDASTMAAV